MTPAAATNPDPQRILIIKPSSLGDVVHALPVLAGLRQRYPQAHIAWLVSKSFAPLLTGHPHLDEVILFDRRHYGRMLRSGRAFVDFWRFVADLRRRRFDLVVDLQGLFRSGFMAWASGARQRAGFSDARELAPRFYSLRVAGGRKANHAVEANLRLARALELPVDPPVFELGLRPDEHAAARDRLTAAAGRPLDPYLALLVGTRWTSKTWPASRQAELLDELARHDLPPVVLLGGPDDRETARAVTRAAKAPVTNLVGATDLRELAALLGGAAAVITPDSGPMHIAAALGRPLVALFGPTSPARTGPYSDAARVVQRELSCVPCYQRQCPLGHQACLAELPGASVAEAVRELLSRAPGKAAYPTQRMPR